MSKINDGGLAFPGKRSQQVGTMADHGFTDDDTPTYADVSHPGMTLRDYVAAKTLAAMVAGAWTNPVGETRPRDMCAYAFEYADAFLAARETSHA